MGVCTSKPVGEVASGKSIDDQIKRDKHKASREVKLLLLGTGESGKSTIFKQIKIIHDHGFSDSARLEMVGTIRKHAVENFSDLFRGAVSLGLVSNEQEYEISTLLQRADAEGITQDVVDTMVYFWESDPMQAALKGRSKLQVADSIEHFMASLPRVMANGFVPTDVDILACRVRTTGVSEMRFNAGDAKFRIVDVGGQRNERRKWIHCFEDVQGMIFVSAISEFDQVIFEDEKTNRLHESLKLFEEMATTRFFAETSMILFLNKKDLFEQKIQQTDLSQCFPDYTGGCSFDHGIEFIKQKFQSKCNKELFTHVTCATSTGNISFVFDSVRETMLLQSAASAGML